MSILKRVFKIGQAEAHNLVDKLEDPIKLTEQGIRDMKKDLDSSLQSLAEVKAMEIRTIGDMKKYESKAEDYESKAILILKKAQSGGINTEDADKLAKESLILKDENLSLFERSKSDLLKFKSSTIKMDVSVSKLKADISKWENELKTLKARVKVSSTEAKINKQLAQFDGSGTASMLEKMQDKVIEQEAIAESYSEMGNETKTLDDEIDKVLENDKKSSSLDELKKKMGLDS